MLVHVVISVRPQERVRNAAYTDTERQKQYRDAHERDPAVKNRLVAKKCC